MTTIITEELLRAAVAESDEIEDDGFVEILESGTTSVTAVAEDGYILYQVTAETDEGVGMVCQTPLPEVAILVFNHFATK